MFTFGPVSSRRLGRSLGIDPLIKKSCNLDCLYCEVGKAPPVTNLKQYPAVNDIIKDVLKALNSNPDWLTLTGAGEPTLYPDFFELSEKLKEISSKPLALITNSTTLLNKKIQKSLQYIDLIMPSLDAPDEDIFRKINHPVKGLHLNTILEGLNYLDNNYHGTVWLEIFLLKDINDSPSSLEKLAETANHYSFNKILLNTVARPVAYKNARGLSFNELENAATFFHGKAEIIVPRTIKKTAALKTDKNNVFEFLARRPADLEDLIKGLNSDEAPILKILTELISEGLVIEEYLNGKTFYKKS